MSIEVGLPAFFGRYQVLEELGSGAMGVVYLCVDPRLARPVAIKLLRLPEFATPAEKQQYEARFRNEAEAAGRLNHPGIVQIYDIGPSYIVMEFLEGRSFARLLKDGDAMTVSQVVSLTMGVADAIDYAHRSGVVHRDLKPANIMLMGDGSPKVLDFGVAHLESSTLTALGTLIGSIRYMAPEQMMGQEIDGRADVFSLASVAYELLTREHPFPARTTSDLVTRVVHGQYVRPREVDPRLPESVDGVFARAFAVRPSERPRRTVDFARALEESLKGTPQLEVLAPAAASAPTMIPSGTTREEPSSSAEAPTLVDPNASREGLLVLESDPPGARIFLDGKAMGETPSSLGLRLGAHILRFEASGRDTVSVNVELNELNPLQSLSVTLSRSGAAANGRVVSFGPGVKPPVRVSGSIPTYPEEARSRGHEGSPVLDLLISEEGEVLEARLVESAGPLLDQALLGAAKGWRFSPATSEGVPVSVRFLVQHVFRS